MSPWPPRRPSAPWPVLLLWALVALASCASRGPAPARDPAHDADHDHCHESLEGEQCHRHHEHDEHDEPGLVSAPVASSSAR